MFGVLVAENETLVSLELLIYESEIKAKEAFNSLRADTNDFNNEIYLSLNLKICAIFDSVDTPEIPEVEFSEVKDGIFIYIDSEGKSRNVQIINMDSIIYV